MHISKYSTGLVLPRSLIGILLCTISSIFFATTAASAFTALSSPQSIKSASLRIIPSSGKGACATSISSGPYSISAASVLII